MTCEEEVRANLLKAAKENDSLTRETLRGLLATAQNAAIAKRGKGGEDTLTEEEFVAVVSREVKKRKEAIEVYGEAGRDELKEKESKELSILEEYLPPQLSEEEIQKKVEEIIQRLSPVSQKDFGKVMGEIMKELKGKADAGVISKILKSRLEA